MAKYNNTASSDRVSVIFQALADPTRRDILERLTNQTMTVTEIARPYGYALPTISKHLSVLERARLIRRVRAGREYHISFAPRAMKTVAEYVSFYKKFWTLQMSNLETFLAKEVTNK